MSAPPKPPPPKPPSASPPRGQTTEPIPTRSFSTSRGVTVKAQKVLIYGPPGVGKTELCNNLRHIGITPLFVDLEDGSKFQDVTRVDPTPQSLEEVHQVLRDPSVWEGFNAIVIDSFTRTDELTKQWVIEHVSHEKPGRTIKSIEDYGWGKGYVHAYESFLTVLQDLDAIIRADKHVICTAHDCTAKVPNPKGEDFIRYEPRLQSPPSGMGSIRHRVFEWSDHTLFVAFDQTTEDGKASGSGTRTIYPMPLPTHMAKSRKLSDEVPYIRGDAEIWKQLFNIERNA